MINFDIPSNDSETENKLLTPEQIRELTENLQARMSDQSEAEQAREVIRGRVNKLKDLFPDDCRKYQTFQILNSALGDKIKELPTRGDFPASHSVISFFQNH